MVLKTFREFYHLMLQFLHVVLKTLDFTGVRNDSQVESIRLLLEPTKPEFYAIQSIGDPLKTIQDEIKL